MGKHTKFDQSDDEREERRDQKPKKSKDRERERSRSPREDSYREKKRERDEYHKKNNRDRNRDYNRRREDFQPSESHKDYRGKGRDRNRERDHDKNRLTEEEIKAQRKALWGNKTKPTAETISESGEKRIDETIIAPAKNEKLWSNAIAATGVDASKANKFMRLMGVKNAPKATEEKSDGEKERQQKLLTDLERQYAVARETAHMGRGNGLGFHS